MKTRIISAVISVAILTGIILLGTGAVRIAAMIVAVMIDYELVKAMNLFNKSKPIAIMQLISPLFILFFNIVPPTTVVAFVYGYLMLIFIFTILQHKSIGFSDAAMSVLTSVIVCIAFACMILIRGEHADGKVWLWAVFVGACISDIGAYFAGTFLGKHKLLPEISPKKTVEGALGGIAASILGFIIYGMIIGLAGVDVNIFAMILLGIVCSLAAQLGDLTASLLKRECNIKDFGQLIPGHGGVLDRFDSILFVAPIVYYFVMMNV